MEGRHITVNIEYPDNRAQAKIIGAKRYFTGVACKHGHVATRSTATGYCDECNRIRLAEYQAKNRDDINMRARDRYAEAPEKHRERSRKWHSENSEYLSDKRKETYAADPDRFRQAALIAYHGNSDAINERKRRKRSEDGDEIRAAARRWREKNADKVREYERKWRAENRDAINARAREKRAEDPSANREYHRKRREKDPDTARAREREQSRKRFESPKERLNRATREMVRGGILRGSKSERRTFELLGYTLEELMAHLERQFLPGMSWDNYGKHGWHVDHVIPLSAHNYETPDDIDFKRAWALSNLQPLWGLDNISKGARLAAPFQPSLALSVAANDNQPAKDIAV